MDIYEMLRRAFLGRASSWTFTTSGGVELTMARGSPLTIGATAGTLYLKQGLAGNPRPLYYVGIGGGLSFGPGRWGGSVAPPWFPSEGLGTIRSGPLAPGRDLTYRDFLYSGYLLDLSRTSLCVGGALTLAFLGMPPSVWNVTIDTIDAIAGLYRAVGLLVGVSVTGPLWGRQSRASSIMGYSCFFAGSMSDVFL